jgi:ribosome assembly protein 1
MLDRGRHANNIQTKNTSDKNLCCHTGGPGACLLAYVSKMFAVPESFLEGSERRTVAEVGSKMAVSSATSDGGLGVTSSAPNGARSDLNRVQLEEVKDDTEVLLGFARLYSGSIRTGARVYCVLPKYQNLLGPEHPGNLQHVVEATVQGLYMMMGRELRPVDCVRTGNIFAIRGLEGKVWRSATICANGIGAGDLVSNRRGTCFVNLGRSKPAVSGLHCPRRACLSICQIDYTNCSRCT